MTRKCLIQTSIVIAATLAAASPTWAMPMAYAIQQDTQELVTINLTTGAITVIGATGGDDIDGLALNSSGVLYGSDNDTNELVIINRNTGAITTSFNLSEDVSDTGIAFDSADSLFLADDAGMELFDVDTSNGNMTLIGTNSGDISAIAFNSSDILYAIDPDGDILVTLSTSTGAVESVVGNLGIDADDEQGLTYDFIADTLYMVDDGSNSLYSVDINSGMATLIANLGTSFESLAFFESTISAPEPKIIGLFGLGLIALTWVRRRRQM